MAGWPRGAKGGRRRRVGGSRRRRGGDLVQVLADGLVFVLEQHIAAQGQLAVVLRQAVGAQVETRTWSLRHDGVGC